MIWNAHSVRCKFNEISNFLIQNSIDIAFFTETWLEQNDNFNVPNYSCYRADRLRGGALILINSNIPHSSFTKINFSYGESASITVHFDNGVDIILSSIYISPSASRQQAKEFFSKILNRAGSHLVAGDFNCKHKEWNNNSNQHKGVDLCNLLNNLNFNILIPDKPTHIPYHGELSTIDFALNKSPLNCSQLKTLNELSSDHLPVCFSSSMNLTFNDNNSYFKFAKANWKKFQRLVDYKISNEIFELDTKDQIDSSIVKLNSILMDCMNSSIPRVKSNHLRYKFSDKIKILTRSRNHFRNLYQRTGDPAYKSSVNQLNRMIRNQIGEDKRNQFKEKLQELTMENNSLFKFTKSLKKKRFSLPPLKEADKEAFSDKEKADMIADSFLKVHLNSVQSKSIFEDDVKESVNFVKSLPVSDYEEFTGDEISSVLAMLKPNKAPGPDSIPNNALKALSNSRCFSNFIKRLFNSCVDLAYFPGDWKVAKIMAIPKTSPVSSNPTDFRPISLISTVGKVFERLILIRLNKFEEENNIIIKQQFGFMSKHSTVQQILRITEKSSLGFNKNKSVGVVLLDLKKAYDSVWHEGLIHKLNRLGYPNYLVKLIVSYLDSRKAFVRINNSDSLIFIIPAGVPQGSIISPHLFNIFINDIPVPKNGDLALFADDTAFFYQSTWKNLNSIKNHLTKALHSFQSFFNEWKIFLNESKTEFIVLTKSSKMLRKAASDVIKFNNIDLNWKNQVKYLGVILDSKLNFKQHIDFVLQKAKKLAFSTLYCLLKKNSYVSSDLKVRIYKSIIRPVFSYACPIFINCARSHLNKLQTFQNKLLRMIFNVNWDDFVSNQHLHLLAHIPKTDDFFEKLTVRFYQRCDNHHNSYIANLGKYKQDSLDYYVKHRLPLPQRLQ
jgi:hypothetical protein